MSSYEDQISATAELRDRQIRSLEPQEAEILTWVFSGSNLHRVIDNPTQEGIDEG